MLTTYFMYGWAVSPERLTVATVTTIAFAALAYALHAVNRSAAVAGGLACFALFWGGGPGAFATLAALFLMTWATTRLGYRRKQELGLAERQEGRNARQVLANLAVAGVGTVLFGLTENRVWMIAAIAALAEAATDTVASEIGQSRRQQARLITTGHRVPAGTDGGITIVGTAAGLGAGIGIAAVAIGAGILRPTEIWIPVISGFVGMLADSVLGATIQRRGWLSNEAVNFFSTLAAAALAYILSSA
ncbi:MAG: DUF92 domain-containing protein [Terriglobales bacterium]